MALPAPSADSTALVTGASSGIGVDLAKNLAARGHGVTLVARREDRMLALAEEIRAEHGVRVEVLACDLGDPVARDGLAARVQELGLTVDILINNAGYGSAGHFVELDGGTESAMVRLNCEAVVSLTHDFVGGMVERGKGAVLIVASSAGFQPIPRQSTYAASKAFALTFSEGLHTELGPKGVAVTALCPGPVKTEFAESANIGTFDELAPGFMWVSPADCAKQAINGLAKNKRIVVPGIGTKLMTTAGQLTPHSILLPVMRRFYPL